MKKKRELIPVKEVFGRSEISNDKLPLDNLEEKEFSKLIYKEIQKLKPKLQTTLILYYYNEFSVKEIAEIMSCLEGTVKSRLYTGRRRLKANLM